MLLIMVVDVRDLRRYRDVVIGSSSEAAALKSRYNILSSCFMLSMGVWCCFCFTLSSDPFLHLLCIATTMGNILNLICRNYSDSRSMTLQLCAVGLPLVVGVLSYGDFRSLILCGFFMPLFASVGDVSQRLTALFKNGEMQTEEKEAFGLQLNEALESMSHGLIMFDDEMRLLVMNDTARQLLMIHDEIHCYGKRLADIVKAVDQKKPYINRVRILEDSLRKRLTQRTQNKIFQMSDNQFVELSIKLRETGGCVLVIEDVTQRIKYQNRIDQLARYDDLTGLSNRNYFHQLSERLLSNSGREEEAAVIFFDLDDFKRVNDMLGHEAGDFILANVGERLRELLPKQAVIGRYGGDEFVVFLQKKHWPRGFENLAQNLITRLTRPLQYNNQILRFGVSLGIATFPVDATSTDRLLKLADLALYESKGSGKNQFTFFTPQMENTLHQRLAMEEELAEAIRNQSLDLHFQPIVSMETGKPSVFEALVRWNRKDAKSVSPAVFIPVAEDLGLIREIGEWTLQEACHQCMTWHPDTSVAVNVSAVQFQVGSITRAVKQALDETGLAPERLEIEITETAVLNDMDHAILVLEELCELGVRISLDDFGTGYSSLSYLHKLPLDKVKIDKSFVDDLIHSKRSQTLLKGITAMGKALDLKLVVEGIESQSQFDLLRDHYNVDFVQGYFFSRALPAYEAKEFADRFNQETAPRPKALSADLFPKANSAA